MRLIAQTVRLTYSAAGTTRACEHGSPGTMVAPDLSTLEKQLYRPAWEDDSPTVRADA